MRSALGDAIRERGFDQRTVARVLGVSQATISRYVSGACDPPTSQALRLGVLLRRPVEVLFADLIQTEGGGTGRRPRRR